MRNLFVLLAFTLTVELASAADIRVNCHTDTANPVANTCVCDLQAKGSNVNSGFTMVSCGQLACEEFEANQKPKECLPGMRGVTCLVSQQHLFTCPLLMPRVESSVKTPEICDVAVKDINSNGYASAYYSYLDFTFCTTAGASFPAPNGWSFTGSFEDGWQ